MIAPGSRLKVVPAKSSGIHKSPNPQRRNESVHLDARLATIGDTEAEIKNPVEEIKPFVPDPAEGTSEGAMRRVKIPNSTPIRDGRSALKHSQ